MTDKMSVRIITTMEGYKKITDLLEYWGAEELIETTAFADINRKYGDIVYLGWNRVPKGNQKIVKTIITTLMGFFNISYKIGIISNNIDNICLKSQMCKKDGDIPNLFLNCRFDNKKIETELEKYKEKMEEN